MEVLGAGWIPTVAADPALALWGFPWRLGLGGLLVAKGLALAFLAVASRRRWDRARHGPAFRQLCASLGVRPDLRPLLARAARRAGLASDASCLISRGCYDRLLARARLAPAERLRLTALGRSLFENR